MTPHTASFCFEGWPSSNLLSPQIKPLRAVFIRQCLLHSEACLSLWRVWSCAVSTPAALLPSTGGRGAVRVTVEMSQGAETSTVASSGLRGDLWGMYK